MILAEWGWRMLFTSIGAVSLLWLIPWCIVAPRVKTVKLATTVEPAGFLEILSKTDAWATFLCLFCSNYGWYFMLTWIPGLSADGAPLHQGTDGVGQARCRSGR